MNRGIPVAGNEEIELYMRTYYSLLRSSGEIQVRSLEDTHAGMGSSLHLNAEAVEPDVSAFLYTVMRLPACIFQARLILMGQSEEVFRRRGYPEVEHWRPVAAVARRRRWLFDGQETLAAFIASVSDIDDILPMLTAFQIEWNKLHGLILTSGLAPLLKELADGRPVTPDDEAAICLALHFCDDGLARLRAAWRDDLWRNLYAIARRQKRLAFKLLAGSFTDYRRAVQGWWGEVNRRIGPCDLENRPVYFVSSNTHSLVNLLSGHALQQAEAITAQVREKNPENLWEEYQKLPAVLGARENWLYYAQRYYLNAPGNQSLVAARQEYLAERGIHHAHVSDYLDVDAQVFELNRLDPETLDPRLRLPGLERLRRSRAVIFNVDYPLGFAAYLLLSQVTEGIGELRGAYVMGKAATLNARVGDVMIPNVVYDEHSRNTYLFRNVFTAAEVAPYLIFGTVFDNQKAVTVRGTFLQNRRFVELFYEEGYTDIEMESGPYLSAIYEHIYPRRYPTNEIVNLFINARYDIGVLHYASDTPYSRRQSLLSQSLSYHGADSTYATAVAILRRILAQEVGE